MGATSAQSVTLFLPVSSFSPAFDSDCGTNEDARLLISLIQEHEGQQRSELTCDPILGQVAFDKAMDLANRDYFSHINPDGLGPNYLAAQAGFVFPLTYRTFPEDNNIESLAAGRSDPQQVFEGLVGSEAHNEHLLGTNDLFRAQNRIGVATFFNPNSTYRYYWVVLIAEEG